MRELHETFSGRWSNGHLDFIQISERKWLIKISDHIVAEIRWNAVWREYVLATRSSEYLAWDCLADIVRLIRWLNATNHPKHKMKERKL